MNDANRRAFLEARNVTKEFRVPGNMFKPQHIAAVDQVSVALPAKPARIVTLVGESGSGKTTLARMMMGLTPATHGQVLYKGKDIATLSGAEMEQFRRDVQPVFQDPFGIYNPFYRVERVLKMLIKNFNLAQSKDEARGLIEESLRAVDLRPDDVLGSYPHQLSGGQCQRVMLARLYLLRPKIILADEPVSMIDVAVRTLFLNVLLEFKEKYDISCLFITHHLATAYYLGGHIMVLCFGRVVESTSIDQLVDNPKHPYTQQLLKAIPTPDPTDRWETRADVKITDRPLTHEGNKCVYVERCPHAMEVCSQQRPPYFKVDDDHDVACFLYDDYPVKAPVEAAEPLSVIEP
jgi:peptide/nickel transport system ATP-binding protein